MREGTGRSAPNDARRKMRRGVSSTSERHLFRTGGAAAIAGAVLALVGNILHPRTSEFGNPEPFLRLIAASPIWVVDHLVLIVAILLSAGGLVAVARSIRTERGAAWAWLALAAAIIGTAVGVVLVASDGLVSKAMATTWVNAPEAEKAAAFHAALAVEHFNFALFSIFIFVFFGLTIFIFGIATLASAVYSAWLGWVAVLDGAASMVVGLVQAVQGPSALVTNVLFVIFSIVGTLWVLAMGLQLWRRGAEPDTTIMTSPAMETR